MCLLPFFQPYQYTTYLPVCSCKWNCLFEIFSFFLLRNEPVLTNKTVNLWKYVCRDAVRSWVAFIPSLASWIHFVMTDNSRLEGSVIPVMQLLQLARHMVILKASLWVWQNSLKWQGGKAIMLIWQGRDARITNIFWTHSSGICGLDMYFRQPLFIFNEEHPTNIYYATEFHSGLFIHATDFHIEKYCMVSFVLDHRITKIEMYVWTYSPDQCFANDYCIIQIWCHVI